MTDYLYRGIERGEPAEVTLGEQRIVGEEFLMVSGSVEDPHKTVPKRTDVGRIGWTTGIENTTAAAVGGVTDHFPATKRFRGSGGLVVVIDRAALSTRFEPIEYDYDWFDARPGALAWVLTTIDAEIRLDGRGLWGLADLTPSGTYVVEHWTPDDLPATTPHSAFVKEQEWVAQTDEVDLSGAIEGVTAAVSEQFIKLRIRDEPGPLDQVAISEEDITMIYRDIASDIPAHPGPFYMLVARGRGVPAEDVLTDDHLVYAHGPNGLLDPMAVPAHYRGAS